MDARVQDGTLDDDQVDSLPESSSYGAATEPDTMPGSQILAVRNDAMAGAASLPDDVADFLDAVWAMYEDWSASALRRLTHEQAPWKDHYQECGHRIRIPDEDMAAYFREHVPAAARVFHPSVVLMPDGFLADEDAEAFAAKVAEYSGP